MIFQQIITKSGKLLKGNRKKMSGVGTAHLFLFHKKGVQRESLPLGERRTYDIISEVAEK